MLSNENNWFKHDSNARHDMKIQYLRSVYGNAGYGMFWMVIEIMRSTKSYCLSYNEMSFIALSRELELSVDKTKEFIDFCTKAELFTCDCTLFWSDSLLKRLDKFEEKKALYKANGLKGGRPRKERMEQPAESVEKTESIDDKPAKQKPVRTKNATVAQDTTDSEEVIFLTDLLISEIKKNNPQAKSPSNISNWRNDIRLLLADGYTFTQIDSMIRWAQSDDFWKSNILSAKKLREKSSTLILQMQRRQKEKPKQESPNEMYERLLKYVNGEEEDEQKRDVEVIDIDSIVL